jgi:hypothetical protein
MSKSHATTRERLNVYRLMTDEALGRAVLELERQLDNADRMQEPAATTMRRSAIEQLDQARAELERRRT